MEPGQIVYRGKTKDGKDFILRYPKEDDLEKLLKFINAISAEKTFIRFQGEVVTLEQEKEYLFGQLKRIADKTAVQLTVFVEDELVGNSDLNLKTLSENHVGVFGIVIAKDFRNQGIGKILIEKILEEAVKNLSELTIVELGCLANNQLALNLYQELGFKEVGRLPQGIKYRDEFVDHVYMYKKIR